MIIGLTGGTGSGKSIVCAAAKENGYEVIDADKIGHNIILKDSSAYNEIISYFGADILLPSGEIDRQKLGAIVFSDTQKLEMLNKITHTKISEEIRKIIAKHKNVLIDAAVIYKSDLINICDKIIVVTSPMDMRIQNITKRDSITKTSAVSRINSQITDEEYIKFADIVIENNGTMENLYQKAHKIFKEVRA